ncbi:uncharacterized protein LOC131947390 [Physella acuta]|uniref:uncharacterized protein LOC131947390 n=1 Tax=Physella acuta TaxID=109671 RepID=UPI0027DE500A|nr:uncharacterized protein LOC131947390 [Physella acuta]
MMVCAGMSQPAIAGAATNGCSGPTGSTCDILQASLPGTSLSVKGENPAHLHDRRQPPSLLFGLNNQDDHGRWDTRSAYMRRRPSFPQGGLDWRLRRKVHQDGRCRQRRKTVSACELPESDEDDEDGPEDVLLHERTCPLFHTNPATSSDGKPDESPHDGPDDSRVLATGENADARKDKNQFASPCDKTPSSSSCLLSPPPVFQTPTQPKCNCSVKDGNRSRNNNNNNNEDQGSVGSSGGIRRGGGGRVKRARKRNRRETVILNVGGHVFETYRATVRRLRTPIFNCDDQLELYYRKSHGDYFFDRDPTAFGSILNFLRTGELHIPTNMCGPALQNELEFWGIEEVDIARCCWTQYNTWKTQCRSLEKLEYDRKFSTTQQVPDIDADSSCWVRHRSKIWTFLQDPGSSRKAKIYAWISIIFVFVSIFSFCAETHPKFKVKARDMTHLASFYEFLNVENIPWENVFAEIQNKSLAANSSVGSKHNQTNQVVRQKRHDDDAGDLGDQHPQTQRKKRLAMCLPHNDLSHDGKDKPTEEQGGDWGNKDLPHPALLMMDLGCLIFFSLEYLTRFICSPSKLNFVRALQNIVDFLAFAPDYIEFTFLIIDPTRNEGVAIMEMFFILRILRLFRIFRLIRHVPGLWILLYTLKASFNELMLMCVFLLIGMVVFATLVHFVEPDGIFTNIPVGFWWSVVTMTTVGYGDMYPQSAAGYFIGSCCAVAGLLMIAFTVPIIVSNFVLYYTHVQYGLARKDREMERTKENEEDLARSRSQLDIEGAVLPSQTTTTTTRNGKSYTFLSNASETEQVTFMGNASETDQPEVKARRSSRPCSTSFELQEGVVVKGASSPPPLPPMVVFDGQQIT